MASQYPPKKNTAFTLEFTLYKNDGTIIANPGTITKKVAIDAGDYMDIAANVTEVNTTYGLCSLVIAQAEMNGDRIKIYIKDDTAGCVPFTCTILTSAYTLDEIMAEVAKIPKSDSNVSWNATALAAINAEVDTALNTEIPGSPTADSINERIATMDTTAIPAIKTVVDTIQAGTDLLGDAAGGLADIHADIASARSEIAAVDGHVADVFDDVGDLQSSVDDILADTNELQLEFVDGGRLDLLIDGILADTDELQIALTDGGRLDLLIDQILADTNELQVDNVNGGRTDLLIDSIITKVDALTATTSGIGACTWAYTLTDSVSMLPIAGAEVWVTTDLAGTNMVAHGFTNASGVVTFFLDAGTNYFWRQHGSYTFTNPDTEIVS